MFPGQNPRPQRPSQFQTNGVAPSAPPQIMGNPGSFTQNSMQIQPQMAIQNINSNAQISPQQLFAFQMNQINNANSQQQKGQFMAQNVANPPQFLNQNVAMQNLNQLLQLQMAMQMPGFGQVVPGNVPLYLNQVSQGMGLQNPNFAMNGHLGLMNASGTVQQSMNGNLSKQMANTTRQLQGQSPLMNSFGGVQHPQTHNFKIPASANSQGMGPQSSNFVMNAHMGPANANGVVQQSKNGFPKQLPNTFQQLQGQLMNPFGSVQQPQTQNFSTPASANTQVCQGTGPQISNFAMNAQLGLLNANGAVQQSMNGYEQMPNATQQLLGQLPRMNPFGVVQQPQTQNFNAPASANAQVNSPGSCMSLLF